MRAGWCCMKVGCMSMNDMFRDDPDVDDMEEPAGSGDIAAPTRQAEDPAAEFEMPRLHTPIVPRGTIAGRALVAVIAIMTFLASLTTGAVMMVRSAAGDWQSDVAREVTIQVRPAAGRDIEADVGRAVALARAVAGVADVRPYTKEESLQLLEPWLGSSLALKDLPVPRLILVRLTNGARPDLAPLRAALAEQIPPSSLDDHRSFVERMRTMTSIAVAAGLAVLALVFIATAFSVAFATRGAMAANRPVIEVLHFIGAKDSFIASHFQRRFLALGLYGGTIGGGCAIALFGLGELASRWLSGTAGDAFATLFGSFSIGLLGYFGVIAQILLIALVSAATSRWTVNRTLATIQ
jgi:cell division transport system permease protein